jgi:multicomponent Na+:H+ antiporter subunit G
MLDEPAWVTALADGVAAVCLLLGALLAFSAGMGVVRFPHVLARVHAVTKPQVLGLVLLLTAVALRVRSWPVVAMLALIVAFQLLTSPVAAHMVGRAAYRTDKAAADLEVDDLTRDDDALRPDAPRGPAGSP